MFKLLFVGILMCAQSASAKEGDMRDWMKNASFTCGYMKITFSPDGRQASYVFSGGGPSGKFRVKYRLESATLSFDYPNPQDGPFKLHWLAKGNGTLLLDDVKCDYLQF